METRSKRLVLFNGAPGVGKSTQAIDLVAKANRAGLRAYYVPEWIKDHANRKFFLQSIDGPSTVGNQIYELNHAIAANYDLIVSCSSPELCAFYANFHSLQAFPSLVTLVREWETLVFEGYGYSLISPFIELPREEYRQRFTDKGRYESFEEAWTIQEDMKQWLGKHFGLGHDVSTLLQTLELEQ